MNKILTIITAGILLTINKVSALPMRTWNFGEYGYEPFAWQQLLITGLAFIGATLIVLFLYKRMKK